MVLILVEMVFASKDGTLDLRAIAHVRQLTQRKA